MLGRHFKAAIAEATGAYRPERVSLLIFKLNTSWSYSRKERHTKATTVVIKVSFVRIELYYSHSNFVK